MSCDQIQKDIANILLGNDALIVRLRVIDDSDHIIVKNVIITIRVRDVKNTWFESDMGRLLTRFEPDPAQPYLPFNDNKDPHSREEWQDNIGLGLLRPGAVVTSLTNIERNSMVVQFTFSARYPKGPNGF
jgi:hypothetical protein